MPFPYVEIERREFRPALVITLPPMGPDGDVFWATMITSVTNGRWPGDVPLVENHRAYGLGIPSVIRSNKVATFQTSMATLVGRAPTDAVVAARRHVARQLGLPDPTPPPSLPY